MANNIENARKYFHRARDIKGSSASLLLGHIQKMREKILTIDGNRLLSAEGRAAKMSQAKSEASRELIRHIHTKRQEYTVNMRKAIKIADAIVHAKAPQPDATKLERFESDFRTLKTEIMLSTRPERAVERLTQFVERIDDAHLASVVREQYADLIGPIIAQSGADGRVKLDLAKTFEQLKKRFESPEVEEARNIVGVASIDVDSPQLFHRGLAENAVNDNFSHVDGAGRAFQPSRYINDTDAYFESRPEARPADYVDDDPIKAAARGDA